MNDRQAAKWAEIRSKGRTRFIWFNGVVLWGLPTAIIWTVFMCALQGWDRLPLMLPIALVCFLIGGFAFGIWTWSKAERQYQIATSKHGSA